MKPEHEVRRVIIREWMSLPKEKRTTREQAAAFAKGAAGRVPGAGDPAAKVMAWLNSRLDRP
ncbi:hypothetical protein SAMN05444161_5110 [Rhizobiales bacterium GAS191]|jgi:hypothetical protein|nr:hypothetical protein SAMN05519103_04381 [Rhizobiales bacterium GAS113]SEE20132.1 hypothetical protein SAMN05444161_5110 [Rhizobiales bacterium GAS191]SEE35707.1 hypothetical protein SAMN05519104_5872 [Rhizobiales bacterium GAS188]